MLRHDAVRNFVLPMVILFAIALIFQVPSSAQETETLNDEDITLAVENELLFDEGVSSHLIDVTTADGIVTLSGSVDNLLAKDRALRIAESVKGVRSVVNAIQVRTTVRTDDKILKDIESALLNDPVTKGYQIGIRANDGLVTLIGSVGSWAEKQIVQQIVKGIRGVVAIDDHIVIDFRNRRPDEEIKKEIERRLENSIWVDAGLVKVEVNDGRVALSGAVGSRAEKRRANGLAWIEGVRQVEDEKLKVQWWARDRLRRESKYAVRSAKEIREAVEDAFLYDPRVFSFHPDVRVENGIVILTGTVDNLPSKEAAEQDARSTVGVMMVKNHLKVRPSRMYSDQEIASAVQEALLVDPVVEPYEIDVSCVNGKVYLTGRIDTGYARGRAEKIAARQPGVVEVQNNLMVDYTWVPKSDWAIQQDVEREFRWDPFIDPSEITVAVLDGQVTLTGEVDTPMESKLAVEDAFKSGARSVNNELEVRYGYSLQRPGYHYEAPYRPNHWPRGMELYW